MLLLIQQVRIVAIFLDGECSQVDAVYKKIVPKLGGTSNMVGSTSISMDPLHEQQSAKALYPNSVQPGTVILLGKWHPRKVFSSIRTTVLGILTIRR